MQGAKSSDFSRDKNEYALSRAIFIGLKEKNYKNGKR
jgi:hypothetical protein